MSLHAGLDTCAIISGGVFTKTYGAASPGAIANLFASRGFLEDAPDITIRIINLIMHHLKQVGIS